MTAVVSRRVERAAAGRRPAAGRSWNRYRPRTFWLFVSPWVAGFVLLTLVPMGFALWMSFTDFDGISPVTNNVGFGNYARAFADPQMRSSLLQTLLLMVVVVPMTVAAGLALAVLLNQNVRGRGIYRTIVFLPAVVPVVAGSLTFRLLFDHDAGAVNAMFQALGAGTIQWLAGPNALVVLISFMLWGIGASMIISLSALQGVPRELTEAAIVDGAGPWQRFSRVTLPIISPIVLFQIVTGVIASLQMFVPALLLSSGDVAGGILPQIPDGLRVYMVYVYQTYFYLGDFGYASALLWLLFLVIAAFTALVFAVSRRAVFYAVGDEEKAVQR